jgi:tape measure domain-containing protein
VSVVANVAINVDSSGAVSKLRQVQQGAQATQRATTDLTTAFSKLQAGATNAFSKLQSGATNAFSKLQSGAAGAVRSLSGLRGVLASIGATAAVSKAFGDAQALMLAQKRLSRLTQEYKQFAGAQQEAERLANKFEVSVTDTAGALGSLASRLGAQGRSLNDIVAVYEGLNSALVATGRSSTEAAAASYQLSQALGSGSLTGDELKTISETLPELLNEVAKAAGVSSLQIRELAKDGKLSADLIIQATKQLRDKYSQDVEANITATQKFQNALSGLSEAVGTELAPAITELLKAGAEALKLFGKLPGPVKTLIAAIAGLTAAFVALAPAISTVIGLLTAAQLAALVAAGPWIALAAGITAAAVALASYRTESEKIGAKAAAGDPAAMAAARNRITKKEQEVAALKAQRPSPRSAKGGDLARAQGELAQLKRDVATGQTAAATPTPTPTPTPTTGTGKGAGKGAGKGKDDAARIAEQIRASRLQLTLAQDIFAIEGRLQQAQLEGNEQLVLARNAQKELAQIASQRADIIANKEMPALEKKNVLDKLAIDAATVSGKLGFDLAKIEQDRTKSFDAIIADLNLELALKTATTEQAREQFRLEAEIAKIRGDKSLTDPQKDEIERRTRKLAAPKTEGQKIDAELGAVEDELKTLVSLSNQVTSAANAIGTAFGNSFKGLISGSMTAKEALASFFSSVADHFLDMAAQIIAKMIQMFILQQALKIFGGALGGGGGGGGGLWPKAALSPAPPALSSARVANLNMSSQPARCLPQCRVTAVAHAVKASSPAVVATPAKPAATPPQSTAPSTCATRSSASTMSSTSPPRSSKLGCVKQRSKVQHKVSNAHCASCKCHLARDGGLEFNGTRNR